MSAFDYAFDLLIGNEGGYSNNPKDTGGETMWGITIGTARANGYKGSMKDLTLDFAKKIAKAEYWDKYHCDLFDPKIAFQVFDAAYNGGFPVKWLQKAVGVTGDGIIGPNTLAAVKNADPVAVVAKFNAYRLMYYTSLKNWDTFGKGWTLRVAHNLLEGAKNE